MNANAMLRALGAPSTCTKRAGMKKVIFGFVVGSIAAMITLLWAVRSGRVEACATGDLTKGLDATKAKALEDMVGDWIHHVRECHVGTFLVDVSTAGPQTAFVSRAGRAAFFVSPDGLKVVDHDNIVYELNRTRKFVAVDGYDPAQKAWIENIDNYADGTMDVRMTTFDDGPRQKNEIRAGERWLEVIQHDGKPGVVFDGTFMPAADAIKLASTK